MGEWVVWCSLHTGVPAAPSAAFHSDAADLVVQGKGKFEELMVCSHEIAASTAQLVAASKVGALPSRSPLYTARSCVWGASWLACLEWGGSSGGDGRSGQFAARPSVLEAQLMPLWTVARSCIHDLSTGADQGSESTKPPPEVSYLRWAKTASSTGHISPEGVVMCRGNSPGVGRAVLPQQGSRYFLPVGGAGLLLHALSRGARTVPADGMGTEPPPPGLWGRG